MNTIGEIAIASLFAALLMIVEHYTPWWRYFTGKTLHPVIAYIAGVVGIFMPYSLLLLYWQAKTSPTYTIELVISALWIIAGAAGVTVAICYLLDSWHAGQLRAREAEEREALYRKQEGQK